MFRIHEVNQHLNSLMSSDISFPMSINLAVGGAGTTGGSNNNKQPRDLERQISRLKDQNRSGQPAVMLLLGLDVIECHRMSENVIEFDRMS